MTFKLLELDHPVKRLRETAGLTQTQLASIVLDAGAVEASEQYVRRIEHGLLGQNTDLSLYFSALYWKLEERHKLEQRPDFVTTAINLMAEYRAVALELDTPVLSVDSSEAARIMMLPTLTPAVLKALAELVDDWFIIQRCHVRQHLVGLVGYGSNTHYENAKHLRKHIMTLLGYGNEDRTSMNKFCHVMRLHPFLVQRFERTVSKSVRMDMAVAANWPVDYRKALYQIGIKWDQIKFGSPDE